MIDEHIMNEILEEVEDVKSKIDGNEDLDRIDAFNLHKRLENSLKYYSDFLNSYQLKIIESYNKILLDIIKNK
jgi:hypothetical protein